MKILLTVGRYAPLVGGSEEVCRQVALGLSARGHEVTVATGYTSERKEEILEGVPIVSFEVEGNQALGIRGDALTYQDFLLEGDFDLSFHYAAQIWTTDLVFPLLGELPYPAVIAPCGYSGLSDPGYAGYFDRLHRVLHGFAAVVHHSSIYQDARYAETYGVPRCVVIPNGVDETEFSAGKGAFRRARGIGDRPLLLSVGNHTGAKGHQAIIPAFQEAAPPDAVLAILGQEWPGGCGEHCRQEASKDPRILLLTGPDRSEVVRAFLDSDIFLFASEVECAPLVILEAMAAGLPWISLDRGNVRELPGGVVTTRAGLGPTLGRLLGDPALRGELGRRGREAFLERHRWSILVPQYEALFQRVCAGELRAEPVPPGLLDCDLHRASMIWHETRGGGGDLCELGRESLRRFPRARGSRLELLRVSLGREEDPAAWAELCEDELELDPWHREANLCWFFLAGALGEEVEAAMERAGDLGLPLPGLRALYLKGGQAGRGPALVQGLLGLSRAPG